MRKTLSTALMSIASFSFCYANASEAIDIQIPEWPTWEKQKICKHEEVDWYAWEKKIISRIDSFFKSFVPVEQWNKWIPESDAWVGECGGGAGLSWIPLGQHADNWNEHLVLVFCFKPYRALKRQYLDIQEAVEMRRKNLGMSCNKWNFIPISNMDGIVEYDKADGKGKCLLRTILSGNWMIVFSYEFNPSSENEKREWEQKREFWFNRLKNMQIEK